MILTQTSERNHLSRVARVRGWVNHSISIPMKERNKGNPVDRLEEEHKPTRDIRQETIYDERRDPRVKRHRPRCEESGMTHIKDDNEQGIRSIKRAQ